MAKRTKKKATARGRGRPPEITRDDIQKVYEAIRAGAYLDMAAGLIGRHRNTLSNWLREGRRELQSVESRERRKPRQKYALHCELVCAVDRALAELQMSAVSSITAAFEGYETKKTRIVRKLGPEIKGKDGETIRPVLEEVITRETTTHRDWRAADKMLIHRFPTQFGTIDRETAIREERIQNADNSPITWSFLGPEDDAPDGLNDTRDRDPSDDRY